MAGKNTTTTQAQDAIKAELMERLERMQNAICSLSDELEEVEGKLNPAPAPFPDVVDYHDFYHSRLLLKEKSAMSRAMLDLIRTSEELANAATQQMNDIPEYCRNRSAWRDTMRKCQWQVKVLADSLRNSADALLNFTTHMARLVTFANCDVVPDEAAKKAE